MASVNFMKIKDASSVKAKNINYTKLTYKQSCERYDKRIEYLDAQPGANKRTDRVSCFGLTVPACEGMDIKESTYFFNDVCKLFQSEFGSRNIVSAVAHFDEIHTYLDHGELKESRGHLHFYVIPEIDGKLNGKKFSSKKRMIELNKKIDELARDKYKKRFLTHEKPRKRTVEELKAITNSETEKRIERNKILEEIKQKLNKECIDKQAGSFNVEQQNEIYKGFIKYKLYKADI